MFRRRKKNETSIRSTRISTMRTILLYVYAMHTLFNPKQVSRSTQVLRFKDVVKEKGNYRHYMQPFEQLPPAEGEKFHSIGSYYARTGYGMKIT
jgi:hypothetical protein